VRWSRQGSWEMCCFFVYQQVSQSHRTDGYLILLQPDEAAKRQQVAQVRAPMAGLRICDPADQLIHPVSERFLRQPRDKRHASAQPSDFRLDSALAASRWQPDPRARGSLRDALSH
jgi:hypothetical protein